MVFLPAAGAVLLGELFSGVLKLFAFPLVGSRGGIASLLFTLQEYSAHDSADQWRDTEVLARPRDENQRHICSIACGRQAGLLTDSSSQRTKYLLQHVYIGLRAMRTL